MNTHYNAISGKAYQGKNQCDLARIAGEKGFSSFEWYTYIQARSAGLQVRKGESGVSVFKGFGKFVEEGGKVKSSFRPLGFARVFNRDQCETAEQTAEQVASN